MEIKVLGTGCPSCKALEEAVRKAVMEMNLEAKIIKVEDMAEILNYGIMTTPALVVDGKIVLKGRVASVEEIKKILK
ncbi:MAG: thioredoxin family protein [Bacteroidales bacterium]|jgi:small redox-active disulfide protein 2|nr:thioredoxin family protein [Bacteroidales bacterium]MDD5283543.1 thioredoxin family protein [Bacteroidales bacterium]MDY0239626.1 thioredoxin family protein [Bacteroidales bacterium]NLF81445.1 thioredoxin family protein [Bacteroidales bacterium]